MDSRIEIKRSSRGYNRFYLDGRALPSVTTIVNRFKESGGLIYWANQQGLEGTSLEDARQAAVTPGSIVHDMIECDIRGREFDASKWDAQVHAAGLNADGVWEKVHASISAYKTWANQSNLKSLRAEVSLASAAHRFGGTLDAVQVSEGVHLCDWKTGSLYPDHVIQIAGYAILWEEEFPARPLTGACLLSCNKDFGTVTHFMIPRATLQIAMDQFLRLRECYDADKLIRKML